MLLHSAAGYVVTRFYSLVHSVAKCVHGKHLEIYINISDSSMWCLVLSIWMSQLWKYVHRTAITFVW